MAMRMYRKYYFKISKDLEKLFSSRDPVLLSEKRPRGGALCICGLLEPDIDIFMD
jgi:hypothetical protein